MAGLFWLLYSVVIQSAVRADFDTRTSSVTPFHNSWLSDPLAPNTKFPFEYSMFPLRLACPCSTPFT